MVIHWILVNKITLTLRKFGGYFFMFKTIFTNIMIIVNIIIIIS